jgi:DNA polymerase III subunit delta'
VELFGDIVGQKLAVAMLRQALSGGAAHAYLFAGPRGVGKVEAAKDFAAGLACPSGGCGACSTCRRVREGLHPDVEVVMPEGAFITVGQIREINRDVALRPYEARARVYLVLDADTMNQEAANAFLRTLEEPPGHVHFVLVTDAPELLPQTIVSRCQRVPFSRVSAPVLTQYLIDRYLLPPAEAETIARDSQGDLDYARALAGQPDARVHRDRLVAWARAIPVGSFLDSLLVLDEILELVEARADASADKVEAKRAQDLEWAADARAKTRIEKAFDQKVKRERRRAVTGGLEEVMEVFASWYRDLAVVSLGAEGAALNSDHLGELRADALPGMADAYLGAVAAVCRAQERFRYNVDARCALEDMVFTMKEALI